MWTRESGYWRVPPQQAPAAPTSTSGDDQPARTELEVLLAEPTGHVSVYLGVVQGPRVQLATDLMARTATGAEITAAQRMRSEERRVGKEGTTWAATPEETE